MAKADLFPKFYLTGVAGFESVSASDWFDAGSRFWSVGPAVQWRIFDAGRIRANIKVQNARQEQALAKYEQTALSAFEDVENAMTAYAKEQVRRRSLEDAVKSSQESLRLANQLYANGLSNFINVLDAERSLYQAQDALVQSDKTVTTDVIALYKSLGGGWETKEQTSALAHEIIKHLKKEINHVPLTVILSIMFFALVWHDEPVHPPVIERRRQPKTIAL